jgi:cytochrome c
LTVLYVVIAAVKNRSGMIMRMEKKKILATLGIVIVSSQAQAQDVVVGDRVFQQCRACHQVGVDAKIGVGPILNGLFCCKSSMIAGYNYSDANKTSGIAWDESVFSEYIKEPRAKMPGTKMSYAGLKDERRINGLIAFLKQYDETGNKT